MTNIQVEEKESILITPENNSRLHFMSAFAA